MTLVMSCQSPHQSLQSAEPHRWPVCTCLAAGDELNNCDLLDDVFWSLFYNHQPSTSTHHHHNPSIYHSCIHWPSTL